MYGTKQAAMIQAKANANRDGNRRYIHSWNGRWYVGHQQVDGATVVEPDGPTRPQRCIQCGTYWADPPSKLCPGCEAYQEHTAY